MELKDKTSEPDDELQVKTWFTWNDMDFAVTEDHESIDGEEYHIVDVLVTPIQIHRIVAPADAERSSMLQQWAKIMSNDNRDIMRSNILCVYLDTEDCSVSKCTACQYYPYHKAVTFKTFTKGSGRTLCDTLDYDGSTDKLLNAFRTHEDGITELLMLKKYEEFMERLKQCS